MQNHAESRRITQNDAEIRGNMQDYVGVMKAIGAFVIDGIEASVSYPLSCLTPTSRSVDEPVPLTGMSDSGVEASKSMSPQSAFRSSKIFLKICSLGRSYYHFVTVNISRGIVADRYNCIHRYAVHDCLLGPDAPNLVSYLSVGCPCGMV